MIANLCSKLVSQPSVSIPKVPACPVGGTIYRTAGRDEQRDLGPAYLRVTMSSPARDKNVLRGAVQKARKEIEKVEKARKEWEEKQKKAQEEAAKKEKEGAEKKETPGGDKKDEVVPEKKEERQEEKKEGGSGPEKTDPKAGEEKKPDVFTPPKIDATVLPFVEWIRDKKGPALLYELRSASDYLHLQDALKQASELPMSLVFLTSSTRSDLHHVVKQLGEQKLLVLLETGVGTLPETVNRYNLAGELVMAGCKIALLPRADTEPGFLDHRLQLAELVRVGLPRDAALKSVTLRPAEALGIDKRVGSIEQGKDADLIFLDGDPLAPDTRVKRVMTLGEIVWEAR